METLPEFAERLCKHVGCYSHPCGSGIVSPKKNKTDLHGHMGVFAWVRELKRKRIFEVGTYKELAEKVGLTKLADGEKPRMHWIHSGIFILVQKDSNADDFNRAAMTLRDILCTKQ